jgi:type I restriction enzyme S subunit
VRWVTLGEIATFKYGYTDRAKDSGTARFLRITDIDEEGVLIPTGAKYIDLSSENAEYRAKRSDLLMARTGATFGKTLFFDSDEPAVYASFLIKIILNNSEITNCYYWHFSKSRMYWEQAHALVSKAGQPQFNANALRRVKVPLPPLEEQARIVAILDRFDALCNDLTQGLPAEIAARKKQYEYYRDKLLNFEEAVS